MIHTASPIQALQQQRLLLELEYQTEKEAFQQQTSQIGLARKVKRGDAWWPIKVTKSYYNSLNQLAVEVVRTSDADSDIEHSFEFGRPVVFFHGANEANETNGAYGTNEPNRANKPNSQGSIRYFRFTGTVSYVDGDRMVVTVPEGPLKATVPDGSPSGSPVLALQNAENLGVQLSFDETSYRLMMEALDRVIKGKGRLGYLRDLFYSRQKPETFVFPPMHFPYLNPTQEEAVNLVLRAKDVAIVHGPPGTGKTTTLVEAIRETLMRENQVLVCAQSNMAVDWISEKLVDRGINVLRIGNPTRVNDKMLSFTYERRFESHPDYPQLWAIRKAIRDLRSHRSRRISDGYHQKLDSLKSRATELEIRINNDLFGEARVIASTLVGSANRLLDGQKFGTLFIDEAAQALEAACWIPMRRVSRVVLAGDHCQLPPTVKSIAALKAGLGKTLMERIVEQHPEAVTLLKIQYRMNDDIMRFSSNYFYDGLVESAPEVKYRGILDLDTPMEWISPIGPISPMGPMGPMSPPTPDYREEFVGESFGRVNKAEAELTLDTLQHYFERIGKQRLLDERIDVGIISPYRAQVQLLRRLLMKREYFKPFRRLISVNTVDGFQGQERDVIVISLVRSNDEGQIGFLRDLRRMNVAITRARMKLIILGDQETMTRHPFYRQLWKYIDSLKSTKD
jgi:hypothetical protein